MRKKKTLRRQPERRRGVVRQERDRAEQGPDAPARRVRERVVPGHEAARGRRYDLIADDEVALAGEVDDRGVAVLVPPFQRRGEVLSIRALPAVPGPAPKPSVGPRRKPAAAPRRRRDDPAASTRPFPKTFGPGAARGPGRRRLGRVAVCLGGAVDGPGGQARLGRRRAVVDRPERRVDGASEPRGHRRRRVDDEMPLGCRVRPEAEERRVEPARLGPEARDVVGGEEPVDDDDAGVAPARRGPAGRGRAAGARRPHAAARTEGSPLGVDSCRIYGRQREDESRAHGVRAHGVRRSRKLQAPGTRFVPLSFSIYATPYPR